MKYWNPRRVRRVREREKARERRLFEQGVAAQERELTFTPGDHVKNAGLMLEALGSKVRRQMVKRLASEGAMSLSKLADPLGLMLSAAMAHLRILERAGIVTTHKRGRIRFCVYRVAALKELGVHLASKGLN